jgi:hypothetical protein
VVARNARSVPARLAGERFVFGSDSWGRMAVVGVGVVVGRAPGWVWWKVPLSNLPLSPIALPFLGGRGLRWVKMDVIPKSCLVQ